MGGRAIELRNKTPNVLSFEDAIASSPDRAKRKLLLGNGFSRACKDDIFSYEALYKQADFQALSPDVRAAFVALRTTDFEIVIKAIRQTAQLARVYVQDRPELVHTLIRDADGLRDLLVDTIAKNHPARPQDIQKPRYEACRRFLDNFTHVYTLNYDLLLYWALMQDELSPFECLEFEDGFRKPEADADYVIWDSSSSHTQTIHYMHGALHIFDAGAELRKYTWCNTEIALIDQIKAALDNNSFPLFVAEDTHQAKMDRIMHSAYLGRSKSSFEQISNDLFVYGFAFGESDDHILQLIGQNKVKHMFVGLYGDPQSPANKKVVQRAESIKGRRHQHHPLDIKYYQAESARVWN
jgi:hypothetical protein